MRTCQLTAASGENLGFKAEESLHPDYQWAQGVSLLLHLPQVFVRPSCFGFSGEASGSHFLGVNGGQDGSVAIWDPRNWKCCQVQGRRSCK